MKGLIRKVPTWAIELGIVVLLALLIWIFVDVSIESVIQNKGGSCIAVVFDKPAVKGADRIIVYEYDQVVADISDKEEVHKIADLFTVANRTCLCDYKTGWRMEIYNGNQLVREVVENCCGDLYEIYDRDLLHWILPLEGDKGQVELSHEEEQQLKDIIALYKHK